MSSSPAAAAKGVNISLNGRDGSCCCQGLASKRTLGSFSFSFLGIKDSICSSRVSFRFRSVILMYEFFFFFRRKIAFGVLLNNAKNSIVSIDVILLIISDHGFTVLFSFGSGGNS